MKPIPLDPETEAVARRVVWFEEPVEALCDPIRFDGPRCQARCDRDGLWLTADACKFLHPKSNAAVAAGTTTGDRDVTNRTGRGDRAMENTEEIWRHVDAKRAAFIALADTVWGTPELNYTEFRSAAEHRRMLEAEGFRVSSDVAALPTALMGEAGEGGPVIAILGEYDALPGLSQEAGIAEQRPAEGQHGYGHGCGHNLLGSGALLAATAVKDYLAANGLPGRVRYYGCPAEEGGAGKVFMVRDGAFDDVDVAISWHPAPFAGVNASPSLANKVIDFSFTGRASHAAAAPHLGRSALDAVELMNVGVNYLREHMPNNARVHYALLDAGGIAPNVVQARAKVRYLIRAIDAPGLGLLVERVAKIAPGRGADDRDERREPGGQRHVEHGRERAAGQGDAGQFHAAWPAGLRRRGSCLRGQDPRDPAPGGYRDCVSPLWPADRTRQAAVRRHRSAGVERRRRPGGIDRSR